MTPRSEAPVSSATNELLLPLLFDPHYNAEQRALSNKRSAAVRRADYSPPQLDSS